MYVKSARKRGYEFAITREECFTLFAGSCYYCGALPSNRKWGKSANGDCLYSGIDRLDNRVGYVSGNVVSCCVDCNRAKSMNTVEHFKRWVVRAASYMVSRTLVTDEQG